MITPICKNTDCDRPIGGKLIGIKRDFCEECEREAQYRVAVARRLAREERRRADG